MVVIGYKPMIGGVAVATERLSKSLIAEGHEVLVLLPWGQDQIAKIREVDGVSIFEFNFRAPFYGFKFIKVLVAYLIFLVPTIVKLRAFIRSHGVNLVVLSYLEANELYFLLARPLLGVPYVVWLHGSDINLMPEEGVSTRRAKAMLIRRANGIVTASVDLLSQARALVKKLPEKSAVIPLGIDPKWGEKAEDNAYVLPEKYILTLAWATPVKGPEIIVEAFNKIKNQFPEISLVMVGSGPDEQKIRKLIQDLSLSERVVRLGTVPNSTLPPVFSRALFGVIPSRHEGFGQVALEFHLMNKCVIASRTGGLPEIVKDMINGLLITPGDVEELAKKMTFLLNNPELCHTLGLRGNRQVHEQYTHEKMSRRFVELFEQVIAAHAPRIARN
jgi:glycosyltransferase involved in cell wall biosynthesis